MASATTPTNEHIVDLLNRILRELEEVKETQKQLAAELNKAAKGSS